MPRAPSVCVPGDGDVTDTGRPLLEQSAFFERARRSRARAAVVTAQRWARVLRKTASITKANTVRLTTAIAPKAREPMNCMMYRHGTLDCTVPEG